MSKFFLPIFFGAFSLIWIVIMGVWLLGLSFAILGTIFWVWMLVDLLKKDFP